MSLLVVLTCDGCGKRFNEPATAGGIASRARSEGWRTEVRGDPDLDLCPPCGSKEAGK